MRRLAPSLVVAFATTALAYAVLRIVQHAFVPEPDPTLVIYSAHAGFFWRGWAAAYAGGMAGVAAWLVAGRHEGGVARAASVLITLAAATTIAAAAFSP